MKRVLPLILVLCTALGACDSPTEGKREVVEVEITPADDHLPIGTSRQLSAAARDAAGTRLNTGIEFTWQSSDPATVSVSATGLVTALRGGSAQITATTGRTSATALISVATPLPDQCLGVSGLRVGEVLPVAPGAGSVLCLEGGSTGAEYTVIPFFGSATAGARIDLQVATSGGVRISNPLSAGTASLAPAAADPPRAAGPSAHDGGWELRLRQREIRELTPLMPALDAVAPRSEPLATGPSFSSAAAAATVPALGTRLTLNTNAQVACTDPVNRTGEVVAVTTHAVVVADIANPAGGFSTQEYAEFGRVFDALVYPTVTRNFGTPSDLDANGRVLIFFTRAVNDLNLTPGSVVGGFFFSRDLFPKSGTNQQQGCAASNFGELLYMMVPDPARASSQPSFSLDNVRRNTPGVMAHELQHLVNASQRLFVRRTGNFEEVWLNEGLSHIAEELAGFAAVGVGSGRNLSYAHVNGSEAAWDAFQTYHRSNFGRLTEHLRNPRETSLFDPTAPLASRGAAWQFLRYAVDRMGGTESTALRALASSSSTGLRNLRNVLGEDPVLWMRDWSVAVYTDDLFQNTAPQWTQPSWNFRSVFAGTRVDRQYPLAVTALPANGTTPVSVSAGGAAYLAIGAAATGRTEIRVSSGGLTPPERLLLAVVRTR